MFGLHNDNHTCIYIYIYKNLAILTVFFLSSGDWKSPKSHFFWILFKIRIVSIANKKQRLLRIESLLKIQCEGVQSLFSNFFISINNKFLNAPISPYFWSWGRGGKWKRILKSPYLENNYVLGSRQNKGKC